MQHWHADNSHYTEMLECETIVTDRDDHGAPVTADVFDARFAVLRPKLLSISRGLVGATAAEDIVQDTYLRGNARKAQLRNADAFDAWLIRIAINLCYDERHGRDRLLDRLRLVPESTSSHPRDVGLRELIEGLRPRERTLIVLHYGYGYPIDEIAALLNLRSSAARSVLFRARSRLAHQLREAER